MTGGKYIYFAFLLKFFFHYIFVTLQFGVKNKVSSNPFVGRKTFGLFGDELLNRYTYFLVHGNM